MPPRECQPRASRRGRQGACAAALLALLACRGPAFADEHGAGGPPPSVPLATVIERARAAFPGRVLEVERERESTGWIYEVKVLTDTGRVVEIGLDAVTLEMLWVEGDGPDQRHDD